MARITLITGGGRSGKSECARRLAESLGDARLFVATCPDIDGETHARIARHRASRGTAGWQTVEEQVDLVGVLGAHEAARVVLVDCLTLWVSNLMYDADQTGAVLDEEMVARRAEALLAASREREGDVIYVTNEVGMGIVPGNAMSRRFRDLAGRCNQVIAAGADRVTLMVSGVAMALKGEAL